MNLFSFWTKLGSKGKEREIKANNMGLMAKARSSGEVEADHQNPSWIYHKVVESLPFIYSIKNKIK